MSPRPAIDRVYWTAAIGQMAVARRDGGIAWAEQWGAQTGILLWEDLASAADWQIAQSGRPTVVVEIPRADIRTGLLARVEDPQLRAASGYRMWIYPEAIAFSHVRWHTYREDLIQEPTWITVEVPAVAPEASPYSGQVTFHADGTMTQE